MKASDSEETKKIGLFELIFSTWWIWGPPLCFCLDSHSDEAAGLFTGWLVYWIGFAIWRMWRLLIGR